MSRSEGLAAADPGVLRTLWDGVFPIVEAILRERGVDVAALQTDRGDTGPAARYGALESVASFSGAMEANLSRMALVEAGIDAWLSTEHLAGVAPHLGLAIGIDLLVRPEVASDAREVLASLESGVAPLPQSPEPCPVCGSGETEHLPETTRMSALTGFLLVGYPRPGVRWRWTCKACRHEWD